MMLSFFLHNVVQPLIQNANPKTRKADIAIAYVVAGVLYATVGILGYIGLADVHKSGEVVDCGNHGLKSTLGVGTVQGATAPSSSCTLNSDFLANFGSDFSSGSNVYAFTARTSLLLQLFTVFPILLLIIRNQAFELFLGKEWPGWLAVAGLNFSVMSVTTLFAALDLQIGVVLSYVGAVGGFVIVFAVPVGMEAVAKCREASEGFVVGEESLDEVGVGGVTLAGLSRLAFSDKVWLSGVLGVGLVFFVAQFFPV